MSTSAITPETTEKAIEAAATALLRVNEASGEYHSDSWTWRDFEYPARAAFEAAVPVLLAEHEKQVREKVAQELEAARVYLTLAKKTDRKLIHELLSMLHGFHLSLIRGTETAVAAALPPDEPRHSKADSGEAGSNA